ncbi:DgyrCDS14881 [Dimorphilus gyrociliatus]|uniref:DgyrCDS14881 n=1 Tax=Dimorphilus gyrociliatus TaxID=2664684 RepID=A0A7I8WFH5_9ANNE|nr:DgyrCDS14881 [Dimorphilus gyrociliatus]
MKTGIGAKYNWKKKSFYNSDNISLDLIGMWGFEYDIDFCEYTGFEPKHHLEYKFCGYIAKYNTFNQFAFHSCLTEQMLFDKIICESEISQYCISNIYLCDGVYDCFDKSDETNCSSPMNNLYFKCDNGTKLLNYVLICDKFNDCKDKSDEKNCFSKPCNTGGDGGDVDSKLPKEFQCKDGQCITKEDMCNIVRDCPDNSDEENCSKSVFFYIETVRSGNLLSHCETDKLLFFYELCNKRRDCPSGIDESPLMTCASNCIISEKVIFSYGIWTHPPYNDLQFCKKPCPTGMYQCNSYRHCVSSEKVCDGEYDCYLKDDEENCSLFHLG